MSKVKLLLAALVSGAALVVAALGILLGAPWWLMLALALIAVPVVVYLVSVRAPGMVLSRIKAEPVDQETPDGDAQERLVQLVETLCLATGKSEPSIYVKNVDVVNAMALGSSPTEASIVVTQGLLNQLNRTELEGVVAHLLARSNSESIGEETLAAIVVGRWLGVLPGFQKTMLGTVVQPHVSVLADREAVELTRYPPGLTKALMKMEGATRTLGPVGRASRHLWLDDPVRTPKDAIDIPLDQRVEVLQEL